MEVIENTLDNSFDEFLDQPLFCFLGTVTVRGDPRISPLWFLWEDDAIWCIADSEKTYPDRISERPSTAVAIVDFDVTSGVVHHVGMRGQATLKSLESGRATRLLSKYLGPDPGEWDKRFRDLDPDRWQFIRFDPDTVVARDQSFVPTGE